MGYDVVLDLIEGLKYQGYSLYVDNFYTSPNLLRDLFLESVLTTGTYRENRQGFPKVLQNSKQWAKQAQRGSVRWVREDKVLFVQWTDNKVVTVATTEHRAVSYKLDKRRAKVSDKWERITVKKPEAVHAYNMHMSRVDKFDQLIATYNLLRKCLRWWKTLFFHSIDIAVVNRFILFKHLQAKHPEIREFHRIKNYTSLPTALQGRIGKTTTKF